MRISAILSIALLLAACRSGVNGAVNTAVAQTSASEGFGSSHALTLADIGSTVHAINDGEVQLAQLAVSRASSPDVRNFATMMIDDHTTANQMLEAAGYRLVPNDITSALNTDVRQTLADLQNRTGADFDRAYIGSQIRMHRSALEIFKTTLLPNAKAQDKTMHDLLSTIRDQVQTHLDTARSLQQRLGV